MASLATKNILGEIEEILEIFEAKKTNGSFEILIVDGMAKKYELRERGNFKDIASKK